MRTHHRRPSPSPCCRLTTSPSQAAPLHLTTTPLPEGPAPPARSPPRLACVVRSPSAYTPTYIHLHFYLTGSAFPAAAPVVSPPPISPSSPSLGICIVVLLRDEVRVPGGRWEESEKRRAKQGGGGGDLVGCQQWRRHPATTAAEATAVLGVDSTRCQPPLRVVGMCVGRETTRSVGWGLLRLGHRDLPMPTTYVGM
ncbi:hypothetical protein GGS23DRAFT_571698 [Durotheca rogersii]|uniref:uncharacterized protein n=1 Tax=Durotheca rogersii TaxID=419775 RepID=UPI0022207708|nr:uncharacterized protein GGS23DRAFT_571698 [Durotheca rogersii]KAI5862301.1 hypothetical protein GGS23DRAFT_571698 [Durotheca rogersii]